MEREEIIPINSSLRKPNLVQPVATGLTGASFTGSLTWGPDSDTWTPSSPSECAYVILACTKLAYINEEITVYTSSSSLVFVRYFRLIAILAFGDDNSFQIL